MKISEILSEDANLKRQAAIAQQALAAQAARSGAFGGSGAALQRAQANAELQRNLQNIQASGLQSAYQQAMQQYSTDAAVTQYGKQGDILKEYQFVGLFPVDIAPIDLDWGSNDSIEEYAITFAYQYWTSDTTDA